MEVLIFHPHKPTLEMIAFCLESQAGLNVREASSYQDAIDVLLEETAVDLVVTSQEPETDKLFKYLLSTGADLPIILIGEDGTAGLPVYPDVRVAARIQRGDVPERLIKAIRENFDTGSNVFGGDLYCRIKTELLTRVVPLRGDIFIRLSNVKYVKLFRRGAQFTAEDLTKYLIKKKVAYLYIRKTDSDEFINKFKEELSILVEEAKPGDPGLLHTVDEVQELIHEMATRLGFTKEVQQLAKDNIKLALKAIGASPRLTRIVSSSQLRGKNYITSHSVMLAHVGCSIAAHMQWPSNTTFQKLVMAALFHDITFTDPHLARIASKNHLESLQVGKSDEQFQSVKNHPLKCSDLVKTLHEVPGDVDVIVAQHHERPDGTGFPKGLHAHQIAPLSAVFIVAHDILDAMDSEGDRFSLKDFLARMESEYQGTSFKKVVKALKEVEVGVGPAPFGSDHAA